MPRTCTVCNHAEREAIERAMLGGASYRRVATQFGASASALLRHRADQHLSAGLMKGHEAEEVARADNLLDDVRVGEGRANRLYAAAEQILVDALKEKNSRTAIQAIKAAVDVMGEARQYLQLRGELTEEFDNRTPATMGILTVLALPKCPGVPSRAPARIIDLPTG